jgi:hypothetical protein
VNWLLSVITKLQKCSPYLFFHYICHIASMKFLITFSVFVEVEISYRTIGLVTFYNSPDHTKFHKTGYIFENEIKSIYISPFISLLCSNLLVIKDWEVLELKWNYYTVNDLPFYYDQYVYILKMSVYQLRMYRIADINILLYLQVCLKLSDSLSCWLACLSRYLPINKF